MDHQLVMNHQLVMDPRVVPPPLEELATMVILLTTQAEDQPLMTSRNKSKRLRATQ